jgi:hypothetical protein
VPARAVLIHLPKIGMEEKVLDMDIVLDLVTTMWEEQASEDAVGDRADAAYGRACSRVAV